MAQLPDNIFFQLLICFSKTRDGGERARGGGMGGGVIKVGAFYTDSLNVISRPLGAAAISIMSWPKQVPESKNVQLTESPTKLD